MKSSVIVFSAVKVDVMVLVAVVVTVLVKFSGSSFLKHQNNFNLEAYIFLISWFFEKYIYWAIT